MEHPTQTYYQIAAKFAAEKHANQQVKGSIANYMLHVSNVAMEIILAHQQVSNFDLNIAIQIALLHDTIEDTDTTYDEIKQTFGKEVADGVLELMPNEVENIMLLYHEKNESLLYEIDTMIRKEKPIEQILQITNTN